MLLLPLIANFEKQNITESAQKKIINITDRRFIVILLYEKNDNIISTIIEKYGAEINELLGFVNLFTQYDKRTFEKWGKDFNGQIILENQDFTIDSDEIFAGFKRLGASYGINKYPAIIIVDPFNTRNCITQEIQMPNGKNDIEIADRLFEGYFRKILELLNDKELKKKSFTELANVIDQKFNNIAQYINEKEELKIKLIDAFDPLRIYYNSMKKKYGKNNVEDYALEMSTSAFNKRFYDDEIKFTRDEIICLSIILGLNIDETNDFILLNNKDDKLLDKKSSKDIIFISFIENSNQALSLGDIHNEILAENAGNLHFKEGDLKVCIRVTGIAKRKNGEVVRMTEDYEHCTEKRAKQLFKIDCKEKNFKDAIIERVEII